MRLDRKFGLPDAIAALVAEATVMERDEREWPTILRHVVLGRVRAGRWRTRWSLSVAVQGHSPIGLMRANQSIADLRGSGTLRFYLSRGEVARLVSATSAVTGHGSRDERLELVVRVVRRWKTTVLLIQRPSCLRSVTSPRALFHGLRGGGFATSVPGEHRGPLAALLRPTVEHMT